MIVALVVVEEVLVMVAVVVVVEVERVNGREKDWGEMVGSGRSGSRKRNMCW